MENHIGLYWEEMVSGHSLAYSWYSYYEYFHPFGKLKISWIRNVRAQEAIDSQRKS